MKINYFAVPGLPVLPKMYNADNLLSDIADYYQVPLSAMSSRSRKTEFVEARQMAFYWLNLHFGYSLQESGAYLGGRDHATGTYSIQTIDNLYPKSHGIKTRFDAIWNIVKPKVKRLKPYSGNHNIVLRNIPYGDD